jgi:hypothetical protein
MERYELPSGEMIDRIVRQSRSVLSGRPLRSEFIQASGIVLAEMILERADATAGERGLAIATLAIAAAGSQPSGTDQEPAHMETKGVVANS